MKYRVGPLTRLKWRLWRVAWPEFDCEDCTGAGFYMPCYCAYHGGIAPGIGPTKWYKRFRRVLIAVGWGKPQ